MEILYRTPIYSSKIFNFSGKKESFFPVNFNNVEYFAYGRVALFKGVRLLDIKEGDTVLIPDYICKVALAPFKQLKINVKFYQVDEYLKPRWDLIEEDIKGLEVKAFLIVNYFGFPNDVVRAKDFCEKNNMFLIEDNAHGFLSSLGGKSLGSFGDISIFCFHKTIPISNGAALVVNNQKLAARLNEKIDLSMNNKYFKHFLRTVSKTFLNKLPLKRHINIEKALITIDPKMDTDSEVDVMNNLYNIGRLNLKLLKKINFETIKKERIDKYSQYKDRLSKYKTSSNPLFSNLTEGIVPYVFPVLCDQQRDLIVELWEDGVEAYPWPFLSRDSREEYFSKRLVCLPIT